MSYAEKAKWVQETLREIDRIDQLMEEVTERMEQKMERWRQRAGG